jgi:exonuclease III
MLTVYEVDGGGKTLRIVSLNVCGLVSKLQTPEFLDFLNKYDIICLSETKTDRADSLQVKNFSVFSKHRKQFLKLE